MPWIPVGEPRVGPPGTIDIVQTTNLPPGASATATIGGTPGARTMTLGIPAGLPGDVGLESLVISGSATITVELNHVYELTVTGNPAIRLTTPGNLGGAEVGIYVTGPATIEGFPVTAGLWAAILLSSGWMVLQVPLPEVEVTPLAPLYDDVVGAYTIQDQPGLLWTVGGVARAPGTYSAGAPSTRNFTANARPGFVVIGTRTFSHTFPTPSAVPVAPDAVSGLFAWWDPSDTTRTTVVSDKVSQITDKSGNGLHLAQATAGSRPPVGSINGKQALTLAGASGSPAQNLTVSFPSGTPAGSAWLTAYSVTTTLRVDALTAGWGPTLNTLIQHGASGNIFAISNVNNTTGVTAFPKVQPTQTVPVTAVGSSAGVKIYVSGTLWFTGTTAAPALPGVTMGAPAGGSNTSIGETFVHNRVLTDTEVRNLHAGLKLSWGTV